MNGDVGQVLHKNIQALLEYRRAQDSKQTPHERLATAVANVVGNMRFVYVHFVIICTWVGYNLVYPGGFDPFPFVLLAVVMSVESIFLATFILITQNRMNEVSERRADLGVQISLLTEHELTQLIRIVDQVAGRLGVRSEEITDVEELTRDVPPEDVLRRIEEEEEKTL